MTRILRVLSGGVVGAALLATVVAFSPQSARAESGGGFCDDTETKTCCCSTNDAGEIISCACEPK